MFHVKHLAWVEDAERLGIALPDQAWDALDRYRELLTSLALPRGTVAAADRDKLWERHIRDALRASVEIPDGASVVDLGSGAGLPGVPLAIAVPRASFVLVEARRGRAAFLEAVVDELPLPNADVLLGRVESLPPRRFDVVVARAFAPAEDTWRAAEAVLASPGELIYWAGMGFDQAILPRLDASIRVSTRSGLADDGPLVIMARQ
jgi:16S rRNA (guanine527-N7)-methyltransferase